MIELLGVGVKDPAGAWRVRRVTATFDAGMLAVITSPGAREADAMLDAVAGRIIPDEGRVWIDRMPLMRETASKIRRRIADVDPAATLSGSVSVFQAASELRRRHRLLWLLGATPQTRRDGVLRALATVGLIDRTALPVAALSPVDRVLLQCARALTSPITGMVIRSLSPSMSAADATSLLHQLRMLARLRRLTVLVAMADAEVSSRVADRVVQCAYGRGVDRASALHGEPA